MSDGNNAPQATDASVQQSQPANQESQVSNESLELLEGESLDEVSSDASTEGSSSASASSKEPTKAEVKKAADKVDAKQSKADPDKYVIKVDGQILELSKEEMVKYAQLGKAGQARMEEAAKIKQEAMQLVEMLRSNPEAVLADPYILGSEDKVIELAQRILSKKLEDEQKSPEAREKERLERELEELRSKMKEEEERRQSEEYERLIQQKEQELETQITDAIESSGLPRSPFVLKRLADVMLAAAENEKDISPKQAMNIVKREMQKDIREYIDAMQEDALEEFISAEKVKKLRQKQLAKAKAAQASAPKPAEVKEVSSAPSEDKSPSKKKSMRDFLRKSIV